MKPAGGFRDRVVKSVFRTPAGFSDNTETFYACDDMLRDDTDPGNHFIENLIFRRQFFSPGLFLRLMTDCVFRSVPLKPGIFEKCAAFGKSRIFLIRYFSVMLFSFICAAEIYDFSADRIGDDIVLHRMFFFCRCKKSSVFPGLSDAVFLFRYRR